MSSVDASKFLAARDKIAGTSRRVMPEYEGFGSGPVPRIGSGEMRSEFMLDFANTTYCNQGSFGVCPRRVIKYK